MVGRHARARLLKNSLYLDQDSDKSSNEKRRFFSLLPEKSLLYPIFFSGLRTAQKFWRLRPK